MNEYWGKLRWCFDEGSNTDIVDDIGVIDVLDVSMEKTVYCTEGLESLSSFSQFVSILHMSTGHCDGLTADDAYALNTVL